MSVLGVFDLAKKAQGAYVASLETSPLFGNSAVYTERCPDERFAEIVAELEESDSATDRASRVFRFGAAPFAQAYSQAIAAQERHLRAYVAYRHALDSKERFK